MPILREDHPRIGCLAVPLSAAAGFVLCTLVFAAVGFSAGVSTVAGLVGAIGGGLTAALIVHRQH